MTGYAAFMPDTTQVTVLSGADAQYGPGRRLPRIQSAAPPFSQFTLRVDGPSTWQSVEGQRPV